MRDGDVGNIIEREQVLTILFFYLFYTAKFAQDVISRWLGIIGIIGHEHPRVCVDAIDSRDLYELLVAFFDFSAHV